MQSKEHRCESCGEVVGSSRRTHPASGRPFSERPKYSASRAAFALALGLLPALVFALGAIGSGHGVGRLTLLSCASVGLVVGAGVWLARLMGEVRRSRKRVADPMYRARLMEFEMRVREPSELS